MFADWHSVDWDLKICKNFYLILWFYKMRNARITYFRNNDLPLIVEFDFFLLPPRTPNYDQGWRCWTTQGYIFLLYYTGTYATVQYCIERRVGMWTLIIFKTRIRHYYSISQWTKILILVLLTDGWSYNLKKWGRGDPTHLLALIVAHIWREFLT